MSKIILVIAVAVLFGSDIDSGYLSQYSQSPTDGTLYYRQYESLEIDPNIEYDGYIAVADCDRIGDEAMLKIKYDEYVSDWLMVVVFDCSGHESTTSWMDKNNIIAEVDYYTARKHGFLDRGDVIGNISWRE